MSIKDFKKQVVSNLTFDAASQPLAPVITGYSISGSDDTALDPAGGQTIFVNGSGFRPGATITMNNTSISIVTFISVDQLSFTSPAMSAGTYNLFAVNSDGGAAILAPGIVYSTFPTWTTAQGSLGSYYETTSISETVEATGDVPVIYTLVSGTLPAGASLASDGTITGTAPIDSSSTTYTFTVKADDAEFQSSTREFSLTINTDVVTWVTPSSGATIELDGSEYSQALSATDAAGYNVSYTANALPTGLTLSSGTISGTSTTEGTTTTLLTATAATTNRSSTNTITWIVALGDIYWKYVSVLLSGSTPTSPFINDASLNNNQLTIQGDTRPNNFNPYEEGYYSNYCDGTGDYLNFATANTTFGTNNFTIEFWFNRYAFGGSYDILTNLAYNSNNAAYNAMQIQQGSLGGTFLVGNGSNAWSINITLTAPAAGKWSHYAFVRSGNNFAAFIDGVRQGSTATSTISIPATAAGIQIGYSYYGTVSTTYGYYSNYRVLNGTAVYDPTSATISVPTMPFTATTDTVLLTCQSNRFVDNSNKKYLPTLGGNISITGTHPFDTPTTVAYNTQYSTTFDGATATRLTIPSNAAFAFNTGAYTMEGWVCVAANPTYVTTLFDAGGATNSISLGVTSNGSLVIGKYGIGNVLASTAGDVPTGQWVHVAAVRTSTATNDTRLYVNGVLRATGTDNNNWTVTTSPTVGGINLSGYTTNGCISNFRVVKGTALYTTSFTPSTTPLTAVSGTSLLTCQDSTLKDNSTNNFTVTSAGNAQPIAVSPFTMTTSNTAVTSLGSVYFDGTSDYLSVPNSRSLYLESGDFTIEFWYNSSITFNTGYGPCIGFGYKSTPTGGWVIYRNTSVNTNSISLRVAGQGGGGMVDFPTTSTVEKDVWNHWAVVRSGTSLKWYKNGVLDASTTNSVNITDTDATTLGYIGYAQQWGYYTQGYLSDVRVVKGSALYTANFLPPQTPLTPVTNTQLLTCQYNGGANNNGFVDQSSYSNLATRIANTTQGTFSPYSQNGWSYYFNGTTDLINTTTSSSYAIAANNYCLEGWAMFTGAFGTAATFFANFYQNVGGDYGSFIGIDASGYPRGFLKNGNSGGQEITLLGSTSITIGKWIHYSLVRTGDNLSLFIDGTRVATSASAGVIQPSHNVVTLGRYSSNNGALWWPGYVSNARMCIGTIPYSASATTIAVPTGPLAPTTGTVYLSAQNNRFIDNSYINSTLTTTGTPSVQAYSPFGGVTSVPTSYSTKFDGTSGSYFTFTGKTSLALGSGDFTIESWVYRNFTSGAGGGADAWYTGTRSPTATGGLGIKITDAGRIAWNTSSSYGVGTTTIPAYTWTHIAVVRESGTLKWYINGVLDYSTSLSQNFSNPTVAVGITDDPYYSRLSVSNFRLVTGTAVYNSDFTPPTSPLTVVSNTALLTCQNNTLKDNSVSPATVTQYGIGQLQIPFNPFGTTNTPNVSYTPSVNSGSMYFDGTGDWLTIADTPQLKLSTSDFTIEGWFYLTAGGTARSFVSKGASTTGWTVGLSSAQVLTATFTSTNITGGTAIVGTWNHFAVTRNSNTVKLYLNGIVNGTGTIISTDFTQTTTLYIGANRIGAVPMLGYMSDVKITKGQSLYDANFYPGSSPATSTNTTTLLLTGASGGIIDYHGTNNFETVGNTQLASEDPYAGSYYSNYFDGTGDYLDVGTPMSLAGDFTIEMWIKPDLVTKTYSEFFTSASANFELLLNTSTLTLWTIVSHQTPVTAGVWHHVALIRSGSTIYLYLDGVRSTSSGTSSTVFTPYRIGTYAGSENFPGFISNLRVVSGSVLYSGTTITVPTAPLAAVSGTQLLTCQSNKFKDNSTNNYGITVAGDTKVKSQNPFQNNIGKSLYFDGTGDYLIAPSSTVNSFNRGDFTIEMWFYTIARAASTYPSLLKNDSGTTWGANYWAIGEGRTDTPNKITLWAYNIDTVNPVITSTTSISTGQWYHIAFTRVGTSIKLYINGSLDATSGTVTGSMDAGVSRALSLSSAAPDSYNGYIKDLRITRGIERTITLPTTPYKDK